MYRKIRFDLLAILFVVCLMLDSAAKAQLNFSTGWGKRSQRTDAGEPSNTECSLQTRPSLEQLLSVYNFLQAEAQKLLNCQKLSK